MTQIISVITKEYALLASDRRLTFAEGPRRGQLFDDDTCKLVSLCNLCGIGYSGLARIEGRATHEWIADILASAKCRDAECASRVIAERATNAFSKTSYWGQIFVIVGWARFQGLAGMRSHICVITNVFDEHGNSLPQSSTSFHRRATVLADGDEFSLFTIGQPLSNLRQQHLNRNIGRLVSRDISPNEILRLLVQEIVNTSTHEGCATVGSKVLGFCIPKAAVEQQLQSGESFLLASPPNQNAATFTYFDPSYNELQQYGPTVACGGFAATDFKTENDPLRNSQSSQMRVLRNS